MKRAILALWVAAFLCLPACQRAEEKQKAPEPPNQQQKQQGLQIGTDSRAGQEYAQDGSVLLSWSLAWPKATYDGQPMNNIGSYYDSQKEKQLLHVQEELLPLAKERWNVAQAEGRLFPTYTWEVGFQVTRQQGAYVSILRQSKEFTGGVHESDTLAAENWLLRDGDCYLLTLQDVLPGAEDARKLLLEQAIAQAEERAAQQEGLYFENYRQLMADSWQDTDFYLTEESLAVFFPAYAIGPYTTGTQIFEIPLDTLGDALAEGLRP